MLVLKRLALAAVVAIGVVRLATLGGSGSDADGSAQDRGTQPVELERGGTSVLPENLIVAFDGAPGAPDLGPIGRGPPDQVADRLLAQAKAYERFSNKPVYPAFHLITSVAQSDPGTDGLYIHRLSNREIEKYVDVARKNDFYVLLDIQPGLSNMPDEVARLKRWLRDPNVGIALDPEWELEPGQVPGQVIGHTSAREVNEVSTVMARITEAMGLPDKVLVVHQFTGQMISNRDRVEARKGVDLVLTADGVGSRETKEAKYDRLAPQPSSRIDPGLKLFYEEDEGLLDPKQVMALSPTPSFVSYE